MTPCRRPGWRTRCAGLLLAALGGCAALAPPPPEALFDDALFGHPAHPAEADSVFQVDEAMREHLRALAARHPRAADWPRALAESLYTRGDLWLIYDAAVTRNAARAFADRSGNCLSLVVMTAALAQELGLEVQFQSVDTAVVFSRQGGLTVRSGHVNVVLRPGPRAGGGERVTVDFVPADPARSPAAAIDEPRVLAMYMNNRAVETLLDGRLPEAYAWARAALRQDPGFWDAYVTLGVVYERAGHPAAAAAVLERVLAHDDGHVVAIGNLERVLQTLGRDADAAHWARRRLALQPFPPFHFLQLGRQALARGDAVAARRLLQRELASSGPSHELYLGLAQAHLALGQLAQARQALQAAADTSATPAEQARYAGKLQALRALAPP